MKRWILYLISYFLLLFFIFPKQIFADVPNPEYFTAKCNPDEVEVECSYSQTGFGAPMKGECLKYENNPSYRFLSGTGSTFGGSRKYCFKPISTIAIIAHHVKSFSPLFVITILFEVPVFFIFGLRTTKALFSVLLANFISVTLFYSATIVLPFGGILILLLMELGVIALESTIIKIRLKQVGWKRIVVSALIANIVSATAGNVALNFFHQFLY